MFNHNKAIATAYDKLTLDYCIDSKPATTESAAALRKTEVGFPTFRGVSYVQPSGYDY